jgi:hypothetical protein
VKRELLIAGAVTTIVAGVAGCSSGNKASGPSSSLQVHKPCEVNVTCP